MKIVIMVDKSAGNESVGHMWTETHVFEESAKLSDLLRQIGEYEKTYYSTDDKPRVDNIQNNIRLQIAQEYKESK